MDVKNNKLKYEQTHTALIGKVMHAVTCGGGRCQIRNQSKQIMSIKLEAPQQRGTIPFTPLAKMSLILIASQADGTHNI